MRGIGDYNPQLRDRINPANTFPQPPGPSNFPIAGPMVKTTDQLLAEILDELKKQSTSRRPVVRSGLVDSVGITLDWSQVGSMDRIFMRNKGPDSAWYGWDVDGKTVDNYTSNQSTEIQAQESVCFSLCLFKRIGFRCATGKSATIHATAFQYAGGSHGNSII